MEGKVEVNGANLWYRISGEGEPVAQIHGAGFGHFNFDPATPELSKHFTIVDYDMRGYGQSDCAAAKLGVTGRLIFKNWIDIARMDPDGPGSRLLAELITWQALSKRFLEEQDAEELTSLIQQILRDSKRIEVFTAACQAMCDMDLTSWLGKITSPALVLGGDEDLMTPWDQGPNGAGQEAIYQGIPNAEKHVVKGSNHSTIFDGAEEHNRVVIDFFKRHSRTI